MDPRFDTRNDPRFKRLSAKKRKIIVDDRFEGLYNSTKSTFGVLVDPRTGARKVAPSVTKDHLYQPEEKRIKERKKRKVIQHLSLEKDSKIKNSQLEIENTKNNVKLSPNQQPQNITSPNKETYELSTSDISDDDDDDAEDHFSWNVETDSSDDDSDSGEEKDEELELEYKSVWNRFENEVPIGEETVRLAIMGCDWDIITSRDLYVLLSSFLDQNSGRILRVACYLSEFGKKRIEDESLHGPNLDLPKVDVQEDEAAVSTDDDDDEDDDEDDDDDDDDNKHQKKSTKDEDDEEQDEKLTEALRKYQKERSRYYYAVVECDSISTASLIYNELEGVDCDFALDGLDIRFIPDDLPPFTNIHPCEPRCEATEETMLNLKGYEPPAAFVSALRHSKVKCTWDRTPAARIKKLNRKFTPDELAELDLKDYLASSDDDDDDKHHTNTETTTMTINDIELPTGLATTTSDVTYKAEDINDIEKYKRLLLGDAYEELHEDVHYNDSSSENENLHKSESIHSDKEDQEDFFLSSSSSSPDLPLNNTKESNNIIKKQQTTLHTTIPNSDDETEFTITVGKEENELNITDSNNETNLLQTTNNNITPWERYLEKRKQQKKQRKEEWKIKERQTILDQQQQEEMTRKAKKHHKNAFPLIGRSLDEQENDDKTKAKIRKAELELLNVGENPDELSSESDKENDNNYKKKKYKKKNAKQNIKPPTKETTLNIEGDERFKELFTNPELAIDTTHPKFNKKSDAYKSFLIKKAERKQNISSAS